MDVLRAIDLFVRVVDGGSLTAAAADCGLSPTMVGNHLQALERRLGATLLNRTTRRQKLTEFGTVFYERGVEILGLVRDAEALALEGQASPRGRLRITAPSVFGAERLMPALADYASAYPAVEIDVVLTDSLVDLIGEGFDVAIRVGNLQDSTLVARPLAPYRLVICAAPAYLKRKGVPRNPTDLANHNCLPIAYSTRSEWRNVRSEWRWLTPEGEVCVPISGRIQVDSAHGLRRAALSGMGVAMLPEVLLPHDIAAGTLVRLLDEYELPSRPVNLVYLRDRRMSPKLRSFVDFAVERFR